jgi:hypothetical protein
MRVLFQLAAITVGCVALPATIGAQEPQPADTVFDAAVPRPAFARDRGPVVAIDEAHANFHTMSGRYRPFAELLRNDGFRVRANQAPFSDSGLAGVQVLVIANALGRFRPGQPVVPAFEPAEETALVAWVRRGGRLLLIADHDPMGTAAKRLAARFGVDMSTGRTADDPHSDWTSGSPTWLVFQRDTGARIGEHPITAGRDSSERIRRVVTFTGQSLSVPSGATALLQLAAGAEDVIDGRTVPAAGRAQALAMRLGEGRVVAFGEAGLFTAQVASAPGMPPRRFGFTWPGNDDRQLALNTVRWLAGAIR